MTKLMLVMFPEIMKIPDLELLDKLILSYVKNWENKNLACFAKDDFLGELFGETPDKINFSILKLEALKLLSVTRVPGARCIKSVEKEIEIEKTRENLNEVFDI